MSTALFKKFLRVILNFHVEFNFITDAENAQWTLAPKEEDEATIAEERGQEDAAATAEEREQEDVATTSAEREEDAATTAAEPQVEEREPKSKPTNLKLSENHYSILYDKLAEYSAEWREIGRYLGFRPSELNEIQAKPLLLNNAPKSWLGAMLADWLQWAPRDQRRSTNYATLEGLSDALNKAGLSEAAQSITTEILKPTT